MNAIEQVSVSTSRDIAKTQADSQKASTGLFEPLPDVLDISEAAEALRVPIQALRDLLRRGKIRGFKTGAHWKVTKIILIDFIKRQEAALMKGSVI